MSRRAGVRSCALLLGFLGSAEVQSAFAQYDSGDPTADEQQVLEVINRARANPWAEGARLGIDITEGLSALDAALVGVRPPLAMNKALLSSARGHSQDMWTNAYFAHNSSKGTVTPGQRMATAGYVFSGSSGWGENIAISTSDTAAQMEDLLMIDSMIPDRGHRINLLDIYTPPYFREIGVGYYVAAIPQSITVNGITGQYQNFITQDFAYSSNSGPFVVGVVYDDTGGLNFYAQGKGISGVTITPTAGSASFAVTASAGGYAFPVATSGTLTVVPSGGGIAWGPMIQKKALLGGDNVKIDFKKSDAQDTGNTGMSDAWRLANFGTLNVDPNADPDGDGWTNLQEYQFATNPNDKSSYPGSAVVPLPPPAASGNSGSHSKVCGSAGVDLLWPLGILLGFRTMSRRRRA
jgi:hypothetical protein